MRSRRSPRRLRTQMIDFTGQVAIVTGAGRGLGRHYALDLARRGAKVVVNDLGCSVDGHGDYLAVANVVVDEIRSIGGMAVASSESVRTPEGGAAIVERALDIYGRVDAVVSNAGIVEMIPFEDIPAENWHRMISTHVDGSFHVCQPAYRVMKSQGYGRIVLGGLLCRGLRDAFGHALRSGEGRDHRPG